MPKYKMTWKKREWLLLQQFAIIL